MKTKIWMVWMVAGLIFCFNFNSFAQEDTAEPFLGMWALTLDSEGHNAGWLEVRQDEGYLEADLMWRGGSVNPVDYTVILNNQLILVRGRGEVVRKRNESGDPVRTQRPIIWYQVGKEGEEGLNGMAVFPNRNGIGAEMVSFTGKKIPPFGEVPNLRKIKYGDPITLFNGKDLEGWELLEHHAVNGWSVKDGALVNNAVQKQGEPHIHYGNIRTVQTFEDFNLQLEVNVPKGSNSGVYLRGIYEVQVMDSYGRGLDSHHMGALYSRITPSVAAEKPAGEWQKMDITLYKRHLTVKLNGKTIIDNQPVKGVTGGALSSDDFSPGPIYLQGDHGIVSYRNMVLKPILN
jgi:hypothetical protein